MILSCDPPRHAFLIHFGKRQQPETLQTVQSEFQGARIQIALNPGSTPPSLVAIHFVRHGFRLPFVGRRDEFSTDCFNLHFGRRQEQHYFHLSYQPRDCQESEVYPGLTLLVSHPVQSGSASLRAIETRPILHGFLVDTERFALDLDLSEFVFEFGADTLKDVPVTLFVERIRG